MNKWILGFGVLLVGAALAVAGDDWKTVATLVAGGESKEVAVNQSIRMVQIDCSQGTVIVNTVVIREGSSKNPFSVARRFNAGESQDIDLGQARLVTGLRISDGGRGEYRIKVK